MTFPLRTIALAGLVAFCVPCGSLAAPTPVPGGANQIAGVSAVFPATVFNGFVRIKPQYFGPARPQDGVTETPSNPGTQVLTFTGILSNGKTVPYMDNPLIVLSDANGVAIDARSVEPNGIILQQAAGANLKVIFWAPADFVADHLTYTCQSARCQAIRIVFKPKT
jgi:hypothetical protein